MEQEILRRAGTVAGSPFSDAAQFGVALGLDRLPDWDMHFIYDGEQTYIVWTDGERVISRVGGSA